MPNKKNIESVSALKEKIDSSAGLVLFDYRSTTVAQITAMRRELKKHNATLTIAKNSLVHIALKDLGLSVKDEMFADPTAVVFTKGEFSPAAKVITDALSKNDKMKLKGGYLDKELLDAKTVSVYANIPTRDVLLSQLVTCLTAPISALAYTLDAVKEKKSA